MNFISTQLGSIWTNQKSDMLRTNSDYNTARVDSEIP